MKDTPRNARRQLTDIELMLERITHDDNITESDRKLVRQAITLIDDARHAIFMIEEQDLLPQRNER